jgi:protein TonB
LEKFEKEMSRKRSQMDRRMPYENAMLFTDGDEPDLKWAFRWFVLVSFLVHLGVLLLFIKNPSVRNALEEMIQSQKKPLTMAQLKKKAEERKPVFIDILDPSKVPLADQSVAPPLPKGYSLSGKLHSHDRMTRKAVSPPPSRPSHPVVRKMEEARNEARSLQKRTESARPSKIPAFHKVTPDHATQKANRSVQRAENVMRKKLEHQEKLEKVNPNPEKLPPTPPVQTTISHSQMQKILSEASLGTPFTRHMNLAQDLAPAYSDRSNDLNRIAANLEDETYSSYIKRIQERFETIGEYPQDAAQRGVTGQSLVTFTINEDGTLAMARLSQSSGSRVLDGESLRIVRVAAPYIALPKSFHKKTLTLTWAFIFYNGGFHVLQ